MESHSQYLASPPLLFMTEVSLHAFKVLFVLSSHHYCLYPKVSKGKKSINIVRRSRGGLLRLLKMLTHVALRCFVIN